MSRAVVQLPSAVADIEEIADYLMENANEETALRFVASLTTAYDRLCLMPGLGVRRNAGNPALLGLRMTTVSSFENYLLFYITTDDELRIIRVLHGARDVMTLIQESQDS